MRFVLESVLEFVPGCDRQEQSVIRSVGGFKEVTPAGLPTLSSASRLGFCFPDLSVLLFSHVRKIHVPQFSCYLFWKVR